jgi:DNA modification methylase
MAGGGVVSDVCLLFERKCLSFDIATRDKRPEIQYHHWDPQHDDWPITRKADLIFFDPPYYIKKRKGVQRKSDGRSPLNLITLQRELPFIESFLVLPIFAYQAFFKMWI